MPFYRVLIVDDDKDFAFSLMENLTLLGYQSVCVSSSQEALKWLKVHSLNTILILSDYELIGETGFDVRKAVKPEFGKIPFVLMSGVINQDLALQGKKERIAGFLHKPFDPNNVKDIIDKNCKEKIDEIDEELDLISGFLDDTKPLMEEIESNILSIEESKGDLSSFDNLMRLLHTIKGTAACVGLEDLSYLSHKYEDLVTATRAGKFAVNEKLTNVFLKGFDKLKEELSQSEERKVLSSEEREDMVSIFQVEDEAGIVAKDKSKDDIVKQVAAIKSLADAKREEISVSVEILDKFMELSGELTVARNASNKLLQKLEKTVGASLELDSLSESLSEIHKVCGGMQNLVVETRKVSLRHVLKTIPRVVRDLSKSTGKNIKFQIYGDDIRVDNSIAKVLSNSIIHMVRNSIDHGLEKPEERISVQKNEEGQLTIKCSDVGDDVFVELIDDGRGINKDRIKQRVIEKGMYSAQEVQEMSDKKVMSMIFEPGFSTAEVITDVSGRGVGMDMVKTSVVNINGRIDIESEKGQGTNIRLVLPKPKAVLIMSSLFVRIGHEKFAIPQAEIGRVVLLNNTSDGIMQEIQGKRYIKLSEEILPIVEIDEVLGFPVRVEGRQSNQFIVLKSELNQFAIPIDEIFDVEEVVVKKLENEMARSDLFLGVTYGDDGDLCLTLNPNAIG
ncbi:MAG: chemotaxis protein CheW, partial [Bdellovibrionales bacterium]|nr:chemotaxis protein CheW [Bdellovibrionales bacterium]